MKTEAEGERPSVRIRLAARVTRFLGSLEMVREAIPRGRPRSRLCRLGVHRWSSWEVRPGDFRTLESKCRRCGRRRLMVYKSGSAGSTETLASIVAAKLRRDLCQSQEAERSTTSSATSRSA